MFEREIHLFVFRRQSIALRFVSGDRSMEVDGQSYAPAQISRDPIRQTAERSKDKLKIRMAYLLDPVEPDEGYPATQAVGDWWRPHIPSDPITVTCLSWDPDGVDPPRVEWLGWAVQPSYTDTELELGCDPNSPHGTAVNQGFKLQRACTKTVYSTGIRGCNLIAGPLVIPATLTAVSGSDITAAAFTAQARPFDKVGWMDGATLRTANVTAHAGTTLTLDDVTGLAIGSEVTAVTTPMFEIEGTLTAVAGLVVTAPEFIGTPFTLAHGWLRWTRGDGFLEERPIMAHNQATGAVTLLWSGVDLAVALDVVATPNCPGTWDACTARRADPQNHFGGAIYRPSTDPVSQGVSMSWG